MLPHVAAISQTQTITILLTIKRQWRNPPQLSSWNTSSPPCSWPGITCDAGDGTVVTALNLTNSGITEPIPPSICDLKNLTVLDLSHNLFTPAKILPEFGKLDKLIFMWMASANLIGEIPESFSGLSSLEYLDLSSNDLEGPIPNALFLPSNLEKFVVAINHFFAGDFPAGNLARELGWNLPSGFSSWENLKTLNLSRNRLSGPIPAVIGTLPNLLNLDLSENQFSGQIPAELGQLRLTALNLSSNQLSGQIPTAFDNLVYGISFLDNPNLCANTPIPNVRSCSSKIGKSNGFFVKNLTLIIVCAVILLFFAFLLIFLIVRNYRRKKLLRQELPMWELTPFVQRLNFTRQIILDGLTENNLIGRGGSGKVYRVPVNESGDYVAVKEIRTEGRSGKKLEKQFSAEVDILRTIEHPNIVKLLCCISSEDSKLLVYEYMENQSLDKLLHVKRGRDNTDLAQAHHVMFNWPQRLEIATGAAQGLSYLHHDCTEAILHCDIKSSNNLLDSEFNAKIADFGLAAKRDELNTESGVFGTFGYMAPEYVETKEVNEKTDVYSFGVVLLELMTGREATEGDMGLADWVSRQQREGKPFIDALDEYIKEPSNLEDKAAVFDLGLKCTIREPPSSRPSMNEVLQQLSSIGHVEDSTSEIQRAGTR